MAQANWTKKVDWNLTISLCCLSGVVGIALGAGITAWGELVTIETVEQQSASVTTAVYEIKLNPFFPKLDALEKTLEQVQVREIVRREAIRQQQLEQTKESLAFHGATSEDIEAHIIQQLSATATPVQKHSYSR